MPQCSVSVSKLQQTSVMTMKQKSKWTHQKNKQKLCFSIWCNLTQQLKAEIVWKPISGETHWKATFSKVMWPDTEHWMVAYYLTSSETEKWDTNQNPSLPLRLCSQKRTWLNRVSLFMGKDSEALGLWSDYFGSSPRSDCCARPLVIFNINVVDSVGRRGRFKQTASQSQDVRGWCN